jgi:hypothetical protein
LYAAISTKIAKTLTFLNHHFEKAKTPIDCIFIGVENIYFILIE